MKWFLLWWMFAGAAQFGVASTGPFDSAAACKAALAELSRTKGDITLTGGFCAPSEVPPTAPGVGARP